LVNPPFSPPISTINWISYTLLIIYLSQNRPIKQMGNPGGSQVPGVPGVPGPWTFGSPHARTRRTADPPTARWKACEWGEKTIWYMIYIICTSACTIHTWYEHICNIL
jgi:hypothetical protein